MMDISSQLNGLEFSEDNIDGSVDEFANVDSDEEMLVALCHLAENITFGRNIKSMIRMTNESLRESDNATMDAGFERMRILESLMSVMDFD